MRTSFILIIAAQLLGCAGSVDTGQEESDTPESAAASAELCRSSLSREEERTALKLVDDICGDTWCEGDFNFAFNDLRCSRSSGSCALQLDLLPRVDGTVPRYARTCHTRDFRGFTSLVQTSESGYQSLNWDFYEQLTDCISRLEDEVRPLVDWY